MAVACGKAMHGRWFDEYQIDSLKNECEELLLKLPVTADLLLQSVIIVVHIIHGLKATTDCCWHIHCANSRKCSEPPTPWQGGGLVV